MNKPQSVRMTALLGAVVLFHIGAVMAETKSVSPEDDLVALVAAANDGDVFELDEDTYAITNALVLTAKCTVKGKGIDKTIIKQTTANVHIVKMMNADAVIEGCNLTGATYTAEKKEGVGVVIPAAGGGTVRSCRITGNHFDTGGNWNYGIAFDCRSATGLITNCIVNANTSGGTTGQFCIYMSAGTMERCLIHNNQCTLTGGLALDGAVTVRWCTIAGNSPKTGVNGGGVRLLSNGAVFEHCLIAGNTVYEGTTGVGVPDVEFNSKTVTFNDCAFSASMTFPSTGVSGTPRSLDVRYIDAANQDYHQKLSSQAKDYGYYTPYDYGGDLRCESVVPATALKVGESLSLNGFVAGTNAGDVVTYCWTITKPDKSTATRTRLNDTYEPDMAGDHTVQLSVAKNGGTPALAPDVHVFKVLASTMTVSTAAELMSIVNDYPCDGLTLNLDKGTYEITRSLELNNDITIRGQGWTNTTIRMMTNNLRVILVNHADALVEGVTLTGANINGTEKRHGAGVYLTKAGTLRNCRVTGNTIAKNWTHGAGIAMTAGLVTHCVIDGNAYGSGAYNSYGGGVYMTGGTLDNCLVYGNTIANAGDSYGGGVYASGSGTKVQNCTFTENYAKTGGGIYQTGNPTVRNCIFAGNTTPSSATYGGRPEWYGGNTAMSHCLFATGTTTNSTIGGTHVVGDPAFTDSANHDYHPLGSAASINRGMTYDGIAATDLDAFMRVSGGVPDIGCYEFDSDAVTVSFSVPNGGSGFPETLARFEASVTGAKSGDTVTYAWTLIDNKNRKTTSTAAIFDFAPTNCGLFTAELSVRVNGGKAIPYALTNCYFVCPHVIYVKEPTEESAAAAELPYESWETAATNLAEAVGLMLAGGEVRAAEGTHPLYGMLTVGTGIKIAGAGIDRTVVKAKFKNAPMLFVNNADAVVSNLTVTGFYADSEINVEGEHKMGAVVVSTKGGTVDSCRITGNRFAWTSLGINHSCGVGVRIDGAKARVTRCIIDRNKGSCSQAYDIGGGVYGISGLLENCLVCCNTNYSGGGVGVAGGTFNVRNCTIVDNVATCPDSSSSYGTWGGGGIFVWYGTLNLVNTIVYGNTCPGVPSTDEMRNVNTNAAVACFFGDPSFVDAAAGDYRLHPLSPAKNVNADISGLAATDLDGNPRVRFRKVDAGCYECQLSRGLILLVR